MIIKQISIFVENKLGRMARITRILGEADVNIRALSIADTSDFGILRLIVDKPEVAITCLKEAGITVTLTDVLAVGIEDKPGSFANIVDVMAQADISIEYMYAFICRSDCEAFVILRIEDVDRGIEVLQQHKIHTLKAEQVYKM